MGHLLILFLIFHCASSAPSASFDNSEEYCSQCHFIRGLLVIDDVDILVSDLLDNGGLNSLSPAALQELGQTPITMVICRSICRMAEFASLAEQEAKRVIELIEDDGELHDEEEAEDEETMAEESSNVEFGLDNSVWNGIMGYIPMV